MESYPRAAMERAMKVQEVMLQAMAKKITWWQAAEIMGISDRHMRRWRERYRKRATTGCLTGGGASLRRKRVPVAMVEKVLGLYREKYFDLNVRHFHEKLRREHGIELSYSWVKAGVAGSGAGGARDASAGCIASGGRGGRCRGCCCTSTAAATSGFRTNAGTT